VVKGISSSESGVEGNKEAIQQENESMNHMELFFPFPSHLLPLLVLCRRVMSIFDTN